MGQRHRTGFTVALAVTFAAFGSIAEPLTATAEPNTGAEGVTVPALNTPIAGGGVTYTITSAVASPDVDNQTRLDLDIEAATGPEVALSFCTMVWELTSGTESFDPIDGTCQSIMSDTTLPGYVTFLVPDGTADADLVIPLNGGYVEVPITFDEI